MKKEFKPAAKYETSVGLTVYNLMIHDRCPECGNYKECQSHDIVPKDPKDYHGYLEILKRKSKENERFAKERDAEAMEKRRLIEEYLANEK